MEKALLTRVRELIASRVGLLVRAEDEALLRKVIAERIGALHLSGAEQYCRLLESPDQPQREREALAVPLTTGETYFFRDSGQHALLKTRILPELLERRQAERTLRIWSAACSSGEEAYSLAMLLDELMADQSQWDIRILGTDINREAIEKARRARYSEWSLRGVGDERRRRYFHRHKDGWALDDAVRSRVAFRAADLVGDPFPDAAAGLHDMDLILCRNTFIYMTPAATSQVADKLAETLADGGFLITGHGELGAHRLGKLRARVFPESIVYQKAAVPPARSIPGPEPERRFPAAPPAPARLATSARPGPEVQPPVRPEPPSGVEPALASETDRAAPAMRQAWRYANQGRRELAEQLCRELADSRPLDAEPRYLRALLAQERGDLAGAKALLKQVVYLDPGLIAAYLDLGDLYAREGDDARARKMRQTAYALLQGLPGREAVPLYAESTVQEVLQYVAHMLNIKPVSGSD